MIVYVLFVGPYREESIAGVFTTLELAQEAAATELAEDDLAWDDDGPETTLVGRWWTEEMPKGHEHFTEHAFIAEHQLVGASVAVS